MTEQRIVTNADLQKALDWLRDSAKDLGDAKARAVKAGHMLKHVEADVRRIKRMEET